MFTKEFREAVNIICQMIVVVFLIWGIAGSVPGLREKLSDGLVTVCGEWILVYCSYLTLIFLMLIFVGVTVLVVYIVRWFAMRKKKQPGAGRNVAAGVLLVLLFLLAVLMLYMMAGAAGELLEFFREWGTGIDKRVFPAYL